MEFAVNPTEEKVCFTIGNVNQEVTFKFALQFATKIIEALTNGNQQRMKEIMAKEE